MANSSSVARSQLIDKPPSRGGAMDGRTLVAKRCRQLVETFTAALGCTAGLSDGQRIDIRKAAELTALAEQSRARALREGTTEPGELTALVRLEGMAARAVRALNLPKAGQSKPQTIADYVARKAAEKAARSAGDSMA